MDPAAALRAFAAVFPAELPDKTMIATLVLVAHHRRALPVWCGAAAAFTLHVALAVTAGQFLRLLPRTGLGLATGVLFAVGAVVLWRGAAQAAPDTGAAEGGDGDRDGHGPGDGDSEPGLTAGAGGPGTPATTALAAFTGTFGVVLLAEAGDLTQLATAGIAAGSDAPLAVGVGALAALWTVAALAVALGRRLADRLPVTVLRRAAAVVFAALAATALIAAL